jgi:alanyl-tRNA synthetase
MAITQLQNENTQLKKEIAHFESAQIVQLKKQLLSEVTSVGDLKCIVAKVDLSNNAQAKDLVFQLKNEIDSLFCVLLCDIQGKPSITIGISGNLVETKKLNASALIREWAKAIKGGGGGQAFYAQAGGNDVSGLALVGEMAEAYIKTL